MASIPLPAAPAAWPVLAIVLAASLAYVSWHLGRGLVPHDDGAIGQAAERVLRGELPHRDFDDIYTGGLAWLNAVAFRLLGTSFWSMRLVLLAAFGAWVPAVFYIARRFAAPLVAGGVSLAAVAWSVPNYPAPMPSWYNLFLATLGGAALLRHVDDRRARWLVAAGVAGGLSVIVKIVGLYYVAAALLHLVYLAHRPAARAGERSHPGGPYAAFVTAGMTLFVIMLLSLIRRGFGLPEVVHFVVPGALLAVMLVRDEWTPSSATPRDRLAALATLVLPFAAGVALPIAFFLVPYLRSGALGALLNGVFVLPGRRFGNAAVPMLPLESMWTLLPLVGLVAAAHRWPRRARRGGVALLGPLALSLAALLLATRTHAALYRDVWSSARNLVPVFTLAGVALLSRPPAATEEEARHRARLMLLLSITALVGIVQFPFAVPVYFCYVAPLVILLGLALATFCDVSVRLLGGVALAFYAAFAVVRMNTSSLYGMGSVYRAFPATAPLTSPRGGLDAFEWQAATYADVERLLREHARGGYTWASPDCPEVYFLSGLRNPTRSLFEFFDNPDGQSERVLAALTAHDVTAIVLNKAPEFSRGITMRLGRELAARYPESADVGKFQVRWRP